MAYVAVYTNPYNGKPIELIFQNKPEKKSSTYCSKEYFYWEDTEEYYRQRGYSTDATDGSINLPIGTIKKLIGRELTINDKPVEIK